MLNRIIIMGRLTRDPELRHTQTGIAVASFSLAVDRDFKNKATGEKETDFVDVVAWRQTGEFVSRYFTKGRMAVVEGRLQMRDWQDKDQNKRRSWEIVADSVYFGDSRRDGDSTGSYATGFAPPAPQSGYNTAPSNHGGPLVDYGAPPQGNFAPPNYGTPPPMGGNNYSAPPAPSGSFSTPGGSPSANHSGPTLDEFSALAEDDGDLPF